MAPPTQFLLESELPESAFLFAGTIDEVVEKAAAQPQ